MDTLMSLQKHLNVDSIRYLLSLIAKLDISQQNEQVTLFVNFQPSGKNISYFVFFQDLIVVGFTDKKPLVDNSRVGGKLRDDKRWLQEK